MIIEAPFTPQQVESLNGFQHHSYVHPFTCGNDQCRHEHILDHTTLYAEEDGWHCKHCEYKQTWAHDFMANGSWKEHAKYMQQLFGSAE